MRRGALLYPAGSRIYPTTNRTIRGETQRTRSRSPKIRIYLPLETVYRVYRNKISRHRFPTFAVCADYAIYEKGITRSCHEPSITTKDGTETFGAL